MPKSVEQVRLLGLNPTVFNNEKTISEEDMKLYFTKWLIKDNKGRFNVPSDKLTKTPEGSLLLFSYNNKPVASAIYLETGSNAGDYKYPYFYKLDPDTIFFIPEALRDSVKKIWPQKTGRPAIPLDVVKYTKFLEIIKNSSSLIEDMPDEDKNVLEEDDETEYNRGEHHHTFFKRDPEHKKNALKRSSGKCELCKNPAPFKTKDNTPYLESHHIAYLSKGGKDVLSNVAVLCPNCHRKMHSLEDKKDVIMLKKNISAK
jgi:hypothetical protein